MTPRSAGVDLILHASFIDDEALEAVMASGAAICPTFTFLANLADHGPRVGAGGMTDVFRGEIKATAAMMRQAYDAGVPPLVWFGVGFRPHAVRALACPRDGSVRQ